MFELALAAPPAAAAINHVTTEYSLSFVVDILYLFDGQKWWEGSNQEIATFCKKNYGVTFPMAAKISVKGKDMAPIYKWLTSKEENGTCNDAPGWNFCKYLVKPDGSITFFNSKVTPLDKQIIDAL